MNTVYLVANGDLRLSANQKCEDAQAAMEKALIEAIQLEDFNVKRAHAFDETKGHGFIDSQKMGLLVFRSIPKDAPLVVAEAVWQYSQHLLGGLISHSGPILTVANWSGTWPGLVGLLNLNGCLTKAGVKYSTLWSEDFKDKFFTRKLREWLATGKVKHDTSHVVKYKVSEVPSSAKKMGEKIAQKLRDEKVIMGIQYQQGLKDLTPASDLVEGLLNNVDRPPVYHETTGKELFAGEALPHFNEVDECAGLDALITNKVWLQLGYAPETTLHDLRWGRQFTNSELDAYVWVFLISGAAPPAHFIGGYKGTSSERQPPMYFRLGGGTCKGISKPGWIVWSRVYISDGQLCFDTGLAQVVELPEAETNERWQLTTPQWPIMHAVLQGISRNQMMAQHKSNHIQVAYGPDRNGARVAMFTKAAVMQDLGLRAQFCGDI